jgi:hypothetical protein
MLIINNKALKITNKWLNPIAGGGGPTPPGPTPTLPAYTLRLKYNTGVVPTLVNNKGTLTQVSSSPNIWDWTYENADWSGFMYMTPSPIPNFNDRSLSVSDKVIEIIAGNTTGVTNMSYTFSYNSNITYIPLIDTSDVTLMNGTFQHSYNIASLPALDTSSCTDFSLLMCSLLTASDQTVYARPTITRLPDFDISSVSSNSGVGGMWKGCSSVISGTDITREYNKLSTKFSTSPEYGPFCWCGYYNSTNPVYTNAEVQAAVEAIPAAWKLEGV